MVKCHIFLAFAGNSQYRWRGVGLQNRKVDNGEIIYFASRKVDYWAELCKLLYIKSFTDFRQPIWLCRALPFVPELTWSWSTSLSSNPSHMIASELVLSTSAHNLKATHTTDAFNSSQSAQKNLTISSLISLMVYSHISLTAYSHISLDIRSHIDKLIPTCAW